MSRIGGPARMGQMKSILGLVLLSTALMPAQTAGPRWKNLEFLFGNWIGAGSGQPGAGQGEYSFQPEINNQIIVRHNVAEYSSGPASGSRHDDLMIIYADTPKSAVRAIYFDSEGHTIRYTVATPAPTSVVFESEASQPGPRYRLTYVLEGRSLNGKFEMADPGKAEYKTYLSWSSVRKP